MKADIRTINRCPFSDTSCFLIDKSLEYDSKVQKCVTKITGIVQVCPFFFVTEDSIENFDGYCTIANAVEKYSQK